MACWQLSMGDSTRMACWRPTLQMVRWRLSVRGSMQMACRRLTQSCKLKTWQPRQEGWQLSASYVHRAWSPRRRNPTVQYPPGVVVSNPGVHRGPRVQLLRLHKAIPHRGCSSCMRSTRPSCVPSTRLRCRSNPPAAARPRTTRRPAPGPTRQGLGAAHPSRRCRPGPAPAAPRRAAPRPSPVSCGPAPSRRCWRTGGCWRRAARRSRRS
mmetsp:Transcript_7560/g.22148  ORF Transcript_7560/g.22148 Transcript_7560/m.22148 type:complete len:210 (-) Transcript_7560:421-1050(-)